MAGFNNSQGFTPSGGTTPSPPVTPDLQQVTDVGNTTTNDLVVSDGVNTMRLEDSALVRDIGSFETAVNFVNPTANRTQTHQDASGTLALLEDLPASATASGTNTYTATLSPAITAYSSNLRVWIRFTNGNTGASTLNLNGLGARNIVKNSTQALVSGDIIAGQILNLAYDGTNFQVVGWVVSNAILQGGNSFGAPMIIGTNDSQPFSIKTAGVVRATFNNGILTLFNPNLSETLLINNSDSTSNGSARIDLQNNANGVVKKIAIEYFGNSFRVFDVTNNRQILNYLANILAVGNNSQSYSFIDLINSGFTTRVGNQAGVRFGVFDVAGVAWRFQVETDNTLNVGDTVNYQALVTADNDIPNRRYVLNNFSQKLLVQTATVTTPTNNIIPNDLLPTYSLPANTVVASAKMFANSAGLFTKAVVGSIVFEVWLGATLIGYTFPIAIGSITDAAYEINAKITFRTVGVTGTVVCGGSVVANSIKFAITNAQVSGTPSQLPTTINTTLAQQVRITARFTSASATNVFNALQGDIYLQNS